MVHRVAAGLDHNWAMTGGDTDDPLLRDALKSFLGEEAAHPRGALAPFEVVALSSVSRPAAAGRITARAVEGHPWGDVGDSMDLFSRLRGRAYAVIKDVCGAPEGIEPAQVSGRIARDAGRFTDMVINPLTSMLNAGIVGGGHDDARAELLARLVSAMEAGGELPGSLAQVEPSTAHGLRVHTDRHVRRRGIYCVNSRNMVMGLGDGEISYDYGAERLKISVSFAFGVPRAAPGLAIDIVDPKGRKPRAPPRNQARPRPPGSRARPAA
ncbi:MAG: hypothetical protein OXU86_03945 [Thaumarchaeota archaeon]|nr:hypothetical protein [Nitrososphaerota archaeon]